LLQRSADRLRINPVGASEPTTGSSTNTSTESSAGVLVPLRKVRTPAKVVQCAVYMRSRMPDGYTLIQFIRERFNSGVATLVIFPGVLFLLLSTVFINRSVSSS
jgi:hypothetical protein